MNVEPPLRGGGEAALADKLGQSRFTGTTRRWRCCLVLFHLIRRARGSAWRSFDRRRIGARVVGRLFQHCCCCGCCLPLWRARVDVRGARGGPVLAAAACSAALSTSSAWHTTTIANNAFTFFLLLLLFLLSTERCGDQLLQRIFHRGGGRPLDWASSRLWKSHPGRQVLDHLSVGRTEVHHQLGVAVKTGAAEATFLRRQCRAELTPKFVSEVGADVVLKKEGRSAETLVTQLTVELAIIPRGLTACSGFLDKWLNFNSLPLTIRSTTSLLGV